DRNLVIVPKDDEAAEAEMACKRDRLVAHTLHEAAVAGDYIGEMIDEIVAEARSQVPLGKRHADGGRETLAQGAGGGLDALQFEILGVSCTGTVELAEILDVLQGRTLIARKVEERI